MKIGLQMFSIKDHLKIDAKGTMEQVAKLGYKYLEPFGTPDETGETSYGFGMNYADTKAFLDANGIGDVYKRQVHDRSMRGFGP